MYRIIKRVLKGENAQRWGRAMIEQKSMLFLLFFALLISVACSKADSNQAAEIDVNSIGYAFPLLSDFPIGSAILAELPDGVLLRSGDIEVKKEDVESQFASLSEETRSLLQDNELFVLEQLFTEKVMLKEAKTELSKKGKDADNMSEREIFREFFSSLTADITVADKDIKYFYEENIDMMNAQSYEEAKPQIEGFLKQLKEQEIVEHYVMDVVLGRKIEIADEWAKEKVALALDNALDKARMSAIPTYAGFYSDQYPESQVMSAIQNEVEKQYVDKINIVQIKVDEMQFLATRYGIQSVPTTIFFDKKGDETTRYDGLVSIEEIKKNVKSLID